jgi:hypothetical protein
MKIQSTQDYKLFKRISGNRAVNKPHVNRLLEAIKENPETTSYNPILINNDFEIIDGQHRFDALRKLELPIHYLQVKNLDLDVVQRLNTVAKTWTPIDFARSFAELGNQNYQIYLDFKGEFHYGHNTLMKYLSLNHPITNTSFKEGRLIVDNEGLSYQYAQQLRELLEFNPRLIQKNAALGILKIMRSSNYKHKVMLKKMEHSGDRLAEQITENDWAREIERLYNLHSRKEPVMLFSLIESY